MPVADRLDRAQFARDGWFHFTRANSGATPVVEQCARKKESLLAQATRAVGDVVGKDLSEYRPEHLVETAMVKSIVRALFRIDEDAHELGRIVTRIVRDAFATSGASFYVAPPYTYIHLPNDESERNAMHRDVYGDFATEHYTMWIPLNPCTHKPMTVAPRTHRQHAPVVYLAALERRIGLGQLPIYQPRELSPDTELGDFLMWDARLHHAGNLNQTKKAHAALNFKLRAAPVPFEPSNLFEDVHRTTPYAPIDVAAFTNTYIRVFNEATGGSQFAAGNASLSEEVKRTEELIASWNLSRSERRRISYALTLGAMRRDQQLGAVARINLIATLLWPEFLWSLNGFIDFAVKRFSPKEIGEFLNDYLAQWPCFQVAELLAALPARHAVLTRRWDAATSYPVQGWVTENSDDARSPSRAAATT